MGEDRLPHLSWLRPLTILPSACPLDCPDSCSLSITVNRGRVTKIAASPSNPLTAGFLCHKVRRFDRELYGDHRVLFPQRRIGKKGQGKFERISWEQALDLLTSRISEISELQGGEAILPLSYGGSNGFLTQDTSDARLFRRLGACNLERTVCAAPSSEAARGLYGRMPGVAYQDFPEARTILLWGANPSATGIHLVPQILEAKKNGARIAVIDPRRIPLAKKADLHIALRPGTDLPLALALIRWIFEQGHADHDFLSRHASQVDELRARADPWTLARAADICDIQESQILRLAEMWVEGSPALVRCGWGPERNRNGGSAVAAILALPAVAGKFGVRGGGYTMSNTGAWRLDATAAACAEPTQARSINMNEVGVELLERTNPSIDLLFVYNMNPLATLPNQGKVRRALGREDLFTVVFDPVVTDTALYADLLLPATTFLEHRELRRGYGSYVLQDAHPVIDALGESRPNYVVFNELCRRLGLHRDGDPETPDELVKGILASDPTVKSPAPGEAVLPSTGARPVLFVDSFPLTEDGKIHLLPPDLDNQAPDGLYGYREDPATASAPLALISPALGQMISSTFGALHREAIPIAMHPSDARARAISDGSRVRVENAYGSVVCLARLSMDMRPGVVFLPKGLWSHHTECGNNASALAPDTLTDLAGGACFNDSRVEITLL